MLTSDMAFREQHSTMEMAINDTKMGSNCESDRENRKCNSKILTATWLSPQYVKRQVSNFETSQLGACLKDIYYLPVGAENLDIKSGAP